MSLRLRGEGSFVVLCDSGVDAGEEVGEEFWGKDDVGAVVGLGEEGGEGG